MKRNSYHVKHSDGRYLVGIGTQLIENEPPPFGGIVAARAAIKRYRLIAAIFCPKRKLDQFTIIKL